MLTEADPTGLFDTPWPWSNAVAQECLDLLAGRDLGRVLDAGGGRGLLAARVSAAFPAARVTVLDPDPSALAEVPGHLGIKHGRIEDLDASYGMYATILLRQVLHYIAAPVMALAALANRLAWGGVMYVGQIIAPNEECGQWLGRHAKFVSANRYRMWTTETLLSALGDAGLDVERVHLMPHWQTLERVRGQRVRTDPRLSTVMPVVRSGDTEWCRLQWFHAVVRHVARTSGPAGEDADGRPPTQPRPDQPPGTTPPGTGVVGS